MTGIYTKLANAKNTIALKKTEKKGRNDYSKYKYFTPEQVEEIVHEACLDNDLLTMFSLKRDAYGEYGVLTIVDLTSETNEKLEFVAATWIPEIKATNIAQQLGGAMTFTERYLKMTAFGIYDNSLDPDTTENTEKRVKAEEKKTEEVRFNSEEFTNFVKVKDDYKTATDALNAIKKKYRISKAMQEKVEGLYK